MPNEFTAWVAVTPRGRVMRETLSPTRSGSLDLWMLHELGEREFVWGDANKEAKRAGVRVVKVRCSVEADDAE